MWLGLGLLLLVGWAAYRLLGGYAARPVGVGTLSAREYATLSAAALATFPRGGAIEPSGIDARIPAWVDGFIAAQGRSTRILIRLLLLLIEQATILFPAPGRGGLRRFSSLRPEQQVAYLAGWRRSRIPVRRLVFVSLRGILTMGYFADPAVLRALNLAPRAIATPPSEIDLLWPPIGTAFDRRRRAAVHLARPSDREPLGFEGTLHPDYEATSE